MGIEQAALAGLAEVARGVGIAFVVPLLARAPLAAEELERSPVRSQILLLARSDPGVPLTQLKKRLGVGWGTVYYHLTRLRLAGLVDVVPAGRRRLLFTPAAAASARAQREGLLRGRTVQKIARIVLAHPHVSMKELIAQTDESPRVVYYHVRRLLQAELIVSGSRTRHHDLTASEDLADLLARLGPAPDEPEPAIALAALAE